ncbi:MAG: TlpA family protein disulfide reductase [Planctomycetales bacterium]
MPPQLTHGLIPVARRSERIRDSTTLPTMFHENTDTNFFDEDPPRRNLVPLWVALGVAGIVGLVILGVISEINQPRRGKPGTAAVAGLQPGAPLPELVVTGWLNGPTPSAATLADRVVVLETWASWCGPCNDDAPRLRETQARFSDQGVLFIGLTNEGSQDLDKVRQFLKEHRITWVNGYGAAETMKALKASGIPSLFVFGADGALVWSSQQPGTLEGAIQSALSAADR